MYPYYETTFYLGLLPNIFIGNKKALIKT